MLVAVQVRDFKCEILPCLFQLNGFSEGFQTHFKARADPVHDHPENIVIFAVATAFQFLSRVAQPPAHPLIGFRGVLLRLFLITDLLFLLL